MTHASSNVYRLIAGLALMVALAGASGARAASPVDAWRQGTGLGDQYQDFNTHLIQIQTVKSIPFFGKTPSEKMSAIRGYYQSVKAGNVRSAATSLRNDFSNGALVQDVAIAGLTQVLTQMSQGKTLDESISSTLKYLTSVEYLVGNLMGGTLGAALGTMIPVPVVGGFLGQMVASVPTMTGAMLGSNVGAKIVSGIRHGNLDVGAVLASVDWMNLIFQSIGATAGMLLGRGIPVPFLGQLVGGVIGGNVGLRLARWLKDRLGIERDGEDYVDIPDVPELQGGTTPNSPGLLAASAERLAQLRAELYQRFVSAEKAGDRSAAQTAYQQYQAVTGALTARMAGSR